MLHECVLIVHSVITEAQAISTHRRQIMVESNKQDITMAMETINALTDDMESGTFPRESTYGSLEKSEHDDVTSMNEQDEKSHPAHNEHLQKTRQYYRDMMLGVNDGLVSTLLLVAGVVGGMSYVNTLLILTPLRLQLTTTR